MNFGRLVDERNDLDFGMERCRRSGTGLVRAASDFGNQPGLQCEPTREHIADFDTGGSPGVDHRWIHVGGLGCLADPFARWMRTPVFWARTGRHEC